MDVWAPVPKPCIPGSQPVQNTPYLAIAYMWLEFEPDLCGWHTVEGHKLSFLLQDPFYWRFGKSLLQPSFRTFKHIKSQISNQPFSPTGRYVLRSPRRMYQTELDLVFYAWFPTHIMLLAPFLTGRGNDFRWFSKGGWIIFWENIYSLTGDSNNIT